MAAGCDAPRRDARARSRFCSKLLLVALACWAVTGVLFVTPSSRQQLNPARSGALSDRWTRWTKEASQIDTPETPSVAVRRFLKTLLSEEQFSRKELDTEMWRETFLSGVSIPAAQRLTLLMQHLRPPDGRLAFCEGDPTLDPIPPGIKRIFIASNQHNSEDILPNLIKQLLELILDHPDCTFFVSIYESGSNDQTPYLLFLFSDVLEELEVSHNIRFNGTLTRQKGQGRIEFLSTVRNAALKPLLEQADKGVMWDRLVFINDVFFCKDDVHRLLLHEGDMTCGMDFMHHIKYQKELKFGRHQIESVKREYYATRLKNDQDVQLAIKIPPSAKRWDSKANNINLSPESVEEDSWMDFYDIWVSHDAAGHHFQNLPPFVKNGSYEHTRLRDGLPFPAECCWNGVAVLNPEPFVKHGLQFRAADPDECRTSECVLLCHDFQRLGYRHVVVDPGVWTTYEYSDARILSIMGVQGVNKVNWAGVRQAEPMEDIRIQPGQLVDCCPLKPDREFVDFKECRTNYSIWNVTSAMERLGLSMNVSEPVWEVRV